MSLSHFSKFKHFETAETGLLTNGAPFQSYIKTSLNALWAAEATLRMSQILQKPTSTTVENLNLRQDGTNSSVCLGITLKNKRETSDTRMAFPLIFIA
jgi:hypothetical protein